MATPPSRCAASPRRACSTSGCPWRAACRVSLPCSSSQVSLTLGLDVWLSMGSSAPCGCRPSPLALTPALLLFHKQAARLAARGKQHAKRACCLLGLCFPLTPHQLNRDLHDWLPLESSIDVGGIPPFFSLLLPCRLRSCLPEIQVLCMTHHVTRCPACLFPAVKNWRGMNSQLLS